MFPLTLDGEVYTYRRLHEATGYSRARIVEALKLGTPTTLEELRQLVRKAHPMKPGRRPIPRNSYAWNNRHSPVKQAGTR